MMDDLEDMGEVDFPSWWQSKITTAENMIAGAKHYLEFELKEPAIDDFVSISDELEEVTRYSGFERNPEDPDSEQFDPTWEVKQFQADLRRLFGKFKGELNNPEFIKGVAQIMVNWKSLLRSQLEEDRKAVEYIRSIEDKDEREKERKRMFDDEKES